MKVISTTNARKHFSELVDHVAKSGEVLAIGRHAKPEALLIKFPQHYNPLLDEITNFNANFSIAAGEIEDQAYSLEDLKKRYD